LSQTIFVSIIIITIVTYIVDFSVIIVVVTRACEKKRSFLGPVFQNPFKIRFFKIMIFYAIPPLVFFSAPVEDIFLRMDI